MPRPLWGPVELGEWDHYVRTTVTVRNDSGAVMGGYPWVGLAEASFADPMADKSVDRSRP